MVRHDRLRGRLRDLRAGAARGAGEGIDNLKRILASILLVLAVTARAEDLDPDSVKDLESSPAQGVPAEAAPSELPPDDFNFDEFEDPERPAARKARDPLMWFNRGMYHFNDKMYFWVLKPVARGWRFALPKGVRLGV